MNCSSLSLIILNDVYAVHELLKLPDCFASTFPVGICSPQRVLLASYVLAHMVYSFCIKSLTVFVGCGLPGPEVYGNDDLGR